LLRVALSLCEPHSSSSQVVRLPGSTAWVKGLLGPLSQLSSQAQAGARQVGSSRMAVRRVSRWPGKVGHPSDAEKASAAPVLSC
jgi:hypothetical protein